MPKPIQADLSGKTAIVTGANSGIGKEVARNLLSLGAHVVMACRSLERGEVARDALASAGLAGTTALMQLDQSTRADVTRFAETFCATYPKLDILVNNAGIYPEARHVTAEGLELTWATNAMGYFWLTNALTDRLLASAPARVVDVASELAGGLDPEDLQFERRRFGGVRAYKQSKQANRMLVYVRSERLAGTGVTVNVVHPGGVNTGIARHQRGIKGFFLRLLFKTQRGVAAGADTATWLAASPDVEGVTGKFWAKRKARAQPFRDMVACEALWAQCEALP